MPDFSKLTKEEKELLIKIGIDIKDINKVKTGKSTNAVKIVNLSNNSGIKHIVCKCCGTVSQQYVDFIKRKDCEGFALKSVKIPSFAVTEEFTYNVTKCEFCDDSVLRNHSKEDLINMIVNLRRR